MKQIKVIFDSGESAYFPAGSPASEAIGHPHSGAAAGLRLAAVRIDNELRSFDAPLEYDCHISPVPLESPEGAVVYRRSLCFLLAIAARELFPDKRLVAGMAIGNGFYHFFDDDMPDSAKTITALKAKMCELAERDIAIKVERKSWKSALEYFKKSGQTDTLALLENLNEPSIPVNECAGFRDLHVTPLAPATGLLSSWDLIPYGEGMLLRYPPQNKPDTLEPFEDSPVLYKIAQEYKERGRVLGIGSVGMLNKTNISGGIRELIMIAESLQNKKLAGIADEIAVHSDKVKMLLIAGPSSSGKTTTSKKIAIQLKVLGLEPLVIELDNYFVDRAHTPRDAEGNFDYECLEAIDIEFLNTQLVQLYEGKEIELPLYDFKTGSRKASGRRLKLGGGEILVMEGIHGLNDALTPRIPQEQKFKLYVSALTQLNLDDHNRVSTTDYRLLRRMVRDYNFRGASALQTLQMWPSVQRGAQTYIFPFQNSADAAFNSALDYELAVLKVFAEPLLRTVKPVSPEYGEARRIQAFLDNFAPIPAQYVPRDSILREFIGESDFHY